MKEITDIFDTYLSVGSDREVNLDDFTRKTIQNSIENCINQNKTAEIDILFPAQERICNLMLRDSYPRFRKKMAASL